MNRFGPLLQKLVDKHGWTINSLARDLEGVVTQPMMGKYVNGKARPRGDTLAEICAKFPPGDAAALARAWVQDQFAEMPAVASAVLKPVSSKEVKAEASAFGDLPVDFREALELLAAKGRDSGQVREMVGKLADMFNVAGD
jgi:transcriptional regulator with XRE-family HTH domain